ncbi:MAG: adenosine kinase, partial [Desulfobacterales bacterium]
MVEPAVKEEKRIVGIGSALVDILSHESDEFLQTIGGAKGAMTLVDSEFIDQTLEQITGQPALVPGGSACNTIIGIGKLGGVARFIGKCGEDAYGDLIRTELEKNQVEPMLFTSPLPTGKVLSIITPDAQRTMFTFLGAASETAPAEMTPSAFDQAAIVHIEGYLIHNKAVLRTALAQAKKANATVSLDLASYTIVEENKGFLEEIVADAVDILIANEDEARAFTGHTDEARAIKALSEKAPLAVLKIGKRGSYISRDGETLKIEPMGTGDAVDTTGAGDLWASGFLFGMVNGYPLEQCGNLGSA